MKRKYSWIAVCVTMVSGVAVFGQQPMQTPNVYGNPGMYGYPGLPTPPASPYAIPPSIPYAPQAPIPPYGPLPPVAPMPPTMPYGPMPYGQPPYANPGPIPADPRFPGAQRPIYNGGPRPGAAEPYLVMPESSSPSGTPQTPPGFVVAEPLNRLMPLAAPTAPGEPYTTYEGPRYMAEMKEDDSRVWAQANFIHWWVRRDSTPPLVTTGNPANPTVGTIGNADTVTLLGNGAIGPKEFSGIQGTLGMWLDSERLESLEIGGFWLGRTSRQYGFTSDPNGNPPLAQPVFFGGNEGVLFFALPGIYQGSLTATSSMEFHSLELNLGRNLLRLNGWTIDSLVGIRYLYLNDSLSINQNITQLPGAVAAGFGIPFPGAATPDGSNFRFSDSFEMTNRFYGGTIGARVNWTWRQFDLGAVMKVSFGATTHVSVINGSTSLNAIDGTSATVPGSSLAQASNIGRATSTDFSVVPELTVTAGYQIAPHLRILVGYTALDWNRIQRVGNQIDRQIDMIQVPTSPVFVPGAFGTRPIFPATRTDFWAQGINVGLELKF